VAGSASTDRYAWTRWGLLLTSAILGGVVGLLATRLTSPGVGAVPGSPGGTGEQCAAASPTLRGSGRRAAEWRAQRESEGEALELQRSDLDLGGVRLNEEHTTAITIRNRLARAVSIRVVPRCGCLRARLEPDVSQLPPGGSAELHLTLVLRNRLGDFEETVRILSEGEHPPLRSVTVRGSVVGGLRVKASRATRRCSLLGQEHLVEFTLLGSSDLGAWRPVALHAWPDDRPDLKVVCPLRIDDSRESPDGGKAYVVTVALPPIHSPGRRRTWCEFATTLDAGTWPRVHYSYEVQPAVRLAVGHLHLGVVTSGRSVSRRVRLLPGAPEVRFAVRAVQVRSVDGRGLDERFAAQSGEDGYGWYVEVQYRGGAGDARQPEALLVVETDHPEVPTLTLPVSVRVPYREGRSRCRSESAGGR